MSTPARNTELRGLALLDDPVRNNDTAFTTDERQRLGLVGLLPDVVEERLDWQLARVLENLDAKTDDIEALKPTALVGVSTKGGPSTQAVVKTMVTLKAHPIIFTLSNPTDTADCPPEQADTGTDGRARVACGTQFSDVTLKGKTYHSGQANNLYIFPAIGRAAYATRPARIPDRMVFEAARASADQVSHVDCDAGRLFSAQANILETESTTATRAAEFVFEQGHATVDRPSDICAWIEGMTYTPHD